MATNDKQSTGISKYLPVYIALLAISGIQIFIAYSGLSADMRLVCFLLLAIFSAALAIMYFMHLAQERRSLFLTLIPATVFVLLMMNMIWSDSARLLHMRPFQH